MKIENLCDWGKPHKTTTVMGDAMVRLARPTEDFWSAYRQNKSQMRSLGVSVTKRKDEWVARWYLPATEEEIADEQEQIELSYASESDEDFPAPEGLSYLPYQKAGIKYGMTRDAVLIADQPGLGKTIQSIGIVNSMRRPKNVLVVVPATLRLNWQREIKKWLVHDLSIGIVSSGSASSWVTDNVVIINFENVVAHKKRIDRRKWDVVIVDEAHRLKNQKAKRTIAILGGERGANPIRATKRILLTGTPICNRPIELYPLVSYLSPKHFGNFWRFARAYCDAKQTSFGWNFNGSSNLEELHQLLRKTVMVRRLKEDVLKDLPSKIREVVTLPSDKDTKTITAEIEAHSRHQAAVKRLAEAEKNEGKTDRDKYLEEIAAMKNEVEVLFADMSKARQDTALAKVPAIVDHLKSSEGPIIVFAHHKSVISALVDGLGKKDCAVVTGETPMEDRQGYVDGFQEGKYQYFVGNIHAAGVGLTLTRSSHVVFAELDWVPGNVEQCEDRAHRIGQKDSVLVQHVVMDGSIDERIAKTIIAKQQTIDSALDRGIPTESKEAVSDEFEFKVEIRGRQKDLIEYSKEKKDVIHRCLQSLSYACDGAREDDGVGFNAADSRIGKGLAGKDSLSNVDCMIAESLLHKYRNQLGELYQLLSSLS